MGHLGLSRDDPIYMNYKNYTVIWSLAIKRLEAYGLWVYYKKNRQHSGSSLVSLLVTNSQSDSYTNSRYQLIFYTTQIHFVIRRKPEGVWTQHTLNFFKPFVITELISQYQDSALKWNAPCTFILTCSILQQVRIWLVPFCLMITSHSYSVCLKYDLIFQRSYKFQTLTWTIVRQLHKNIFFKANIHTKSILLL